MEVGNAFVLGCVALAAAVGAGCGGSDSPPVRPPFPPIQANGNVPVDTFAAYAERVEEGWEADPKMLASAFLEPWLRGRNHTVAVATEVDGAVVTVTVEGLEDDSIRDERMEVAVVEDGDVWVVGSAGWSQRCWPNRGHQDFSVGPCV
jgi:hypothetical protein